MGVFDTAVKTISNLVGITAKGQATMANSLPIVVASNQSAIPVADNSGSLTVDVPAGSDVTTGNTSDAAVITDTTGTVSGKLRGLVKWAAERMPASLGQKAQAASFPVVLPSDQRVDIGQTYSMLTLTPATPAPAGSDIVDVGGNAIEAADLTIRDNSSHHFFIPVGSGGYRSCLIGVTNDAATAWDQTPSIRIAGAFSVSYTGICAWLSEFDWVTDADDQFSCGVGDIGAGGIAGSSPASAAAGISWYNIPGMDAGWPYIVLLIQFGSAPSQGEIDQIYIARMRF
jgi:hypothetical protein